MEPLRVSPLMALAFANTVKEIVEYKVMEECLSDAFFKGSITEQELIEELTKRRTKVKEMKEGLWKLNGVQDVLDALKQ